MWNMVDGISMILFDVLMWIMSKRFDVLMIAMGLIGSQRGKGH